MTKRAMVCVVLVVAGLGSSTMIAAHDHHGRGRQWAVVYLAEPTLVGSTIVQGPVIFTHDDDKMARGEPCTSIRLFEPATGPLEEVASFRCIARKGAITHRFTLTTRPNVADGYGCVLSAYQFAGDPEIHEVPIARVAH